MPAGCPCCGQLYVDGAIIMRLGELEGRESAGQDVKRLRTRLAIAGEFIDVMSQAALYRHVLRMEEAGLVYKDGDVLSGRSARAKTYRLTPEGREEYEALRRCVR